MKRSNGPIPDRFVAHWFPDTGWCVLSPWIKAKDGKPYRHHCADGLRENEARHLAAELMQAGGRRREFYF